MSNPWLQEAQAAVVDYRAGRARGEYPVKPQVGLCQKACRCLYEAVTHQPQQWRSGTADAARKIAIQQKRAIVSDGDGGAYHKAVAASKIVPGAELYMAYGAYGHVVTVVEVIGDAAKSMVYVRVFENTSAGKPRGPGTVISLLSDVCGSLGSGRILAVVPVERPS